MNNLNRRFFIIGIASILMLGMGVTYAYWVTNIKGEGKNITVTIDELKIKFTDGQTIASNMIEPGWTSSKTFTIENQSKELVNYNILLDDYINTFVTNGFLQYKITSTNGYNMSDYKDLPKSSTSDKKTIANNITVDANETQTYTIEFQYKNSDSDQSADMGKKLSGKLAIETNTN